VIRNVHFIPVVASEAGPDRDLVGPLWICPYTVSTEISKNVLRHLRGAVSCVHVQKSDSSDYKIDANFKNVNFGVVFPHKYPISLSFTPYNEGLRHFFYKFTFF
jgi:phage terminase large subunit